MATHHAPPPRTPSPKIRIHRSQSFDSPSSRISNTTPIDDSPYSKSAGALTAKPLPSYNALKAAEQAMIRHVGNKVVLHTRMSDDSILSESESESNSSAASSIQCSPISPDARFGLFASGSPAFPSAPSPPMAQTTLPPNTLNESVVAPNLAMYQDPNVQMYDPWLVRVVLDMYDVRGFDWTMIAEPIERVWGCRTSSAEVLGILTRNGRIRGCVWWD
ncbi:uncharacterized protein BDR25DRAFT_76815 [Lindgomyces ingoldianus]|uniref:Uncharacterized protein n=1 Tax=Lindgomyces ingoldianus TaxID=673940 RepID=A0ACB6QI22_9PLEO|nr:uncharacterized protein BDR25DRAFT_76815 [Lindgomyces ingoldianus]KAF2466238.1 hypothetical protein BDR25DRAFT_76815 [Lindgomyces ingoldianus]